MPEWTTGDLMHDPHLPMWPGEHCRYEECQKPGAWRLGFKAYALGYPRRADYSVTGMIPLLVCAEHHGTLRVEEVFTDTGWEQLQNALRSEGRQVLDRASLELIYYRIRRPNALDVAVMEDRR